ncbi:MAG TPA: MFS transporter [Terracidiphilus sp.]|nr:MFS transporter [Terracidiphilus sp.]
MNPSDSITASRGSPGAAISHARRWSILALLFSAAVINYIDRGTISVALPLVAHDLKFGAEHKGVLLSAFFWSYSLLQVPVGWATDRFNLRWFFSIMFLLWSLAEGLTGLATGLGMLIVFRILLGIGESIYMPAGIKIVSLLFMPAERGSATGLFHCGSFLGLVIGAPLTALLISRYGWHYMFPIVGLMALPWLAAWLAAFPSRLPSHDSARNFEPHEDRPKARGITFDRNLAGICLGQFTSGYFWYLLVTWLPDYLVTARHLPLVTAGMYASLPYLIFAVTEPLGGWFADKLIRRGYSETTVRKSIVSLASLFGLLLIPATRVGSASTAIWLIVGATLVGLSWAQNWVFPQCCAPRDQVGAWSGLGNFLATVAGAVAPLVTGFLVARTGSYTPAFTLGALILIAGAFSYWFVLGELKPIPRAETRGAQA